MNETKNTQEQVVEEKRMSKISKKVAIVAGVALIGAAGLAIKVMSKDKHKCNMELEEVEEVIPDVNNMSDKEYVRHLHNIEIIPDDVMNYVENIEQENKALAQEVEELSIDKQELQETIDFLERDIEELEAQILGHEK